MSIRAHTATVDVEPDPSAGAGAIWARRAFLALLAVIVVAGALDFFGVRSRTSTTHSGDGALTMSVHYAQVARAGLDVPFQVTLRRRHGFDGDVLLSISSSYLELFNRNAIDPDPTSATTTADATIWQFDAPPGDTLVVAFDMQVQGGRHWGRSGTITALDEDGHALARTHIKTWLAP